MTAHTIPPIAVESAKEAAQRLLELCTTGELLDRDTVRTHALDVLDALTPDEEEDPAPSLEILHRAANCRCFVVPALAPAPAICRECSEGKCGNCDTTAWDDTLDAPTACSCAHPGVRS